MFGYVWRSLDILSHPKYGVSIKANASYIVRGLTKICVFLKSFKPSEGHFIILYNLILKLH